MRTICLAMLLVSGCADKISSCSQAECVGTVGPEGPAGMAGPAGAKGEAGAQGAVGPAGSLHLKDGAGNILGLFMGFNAYNNSTTAGSSLSYQDIDGAVWSILPGGQFGTGSAEYIYPDTTLWASSDCTGQAYIAPLYVVGQTAWDGSNLYKVANGALTVSVQSTKSAGSCNSASSGSMKLYGLTMIGTQKPVSPDGPFQIGQ